MPDVPVVSAPDAPGRRWARRNRRGAGGVSRLAVQFALSGLVALIIVGVVGVLVLRRTAESEAIRDARQVTRLVAEGVIEPSLDAGLVRGDQASLTRFDRVVRERALRDPIVRIKLWTGDGRIVYSDERRLIGAVYTLDEDEQASLGQGGVDAAISDLSRPENRFERTAGKLLEVYLPVKQPNGDRLLFEAYLRFSSVAASRTRVWRTFVPVLVAALIVLWIVQLPLAWSLARRLQRGQREREQLLLRAIDASDTERRRIAADVHDGAVQDLAGIAFSLAAGADRIGVASSSETAQTLRQAAADTREAMRRLRTLLLEIYPPNLRKAGLGNALEDLLAPLRARGIKARLEVDEDLVPRAETEQLVFRTAQEALRNVLAHAGAAHVLVRLDAVDRVVQLLVEDDGRGFDASTPGPGRAEGHLGLTLLADRAGDVGGTLEVESTPGRGTRVRLVAPR